jgi:S1-C subfamily serine protease
VAGPGLVVTNAHVVAGEQDTVVQVHGNPPSLPARALVFDVQDDIAVLRVPGLDEPALTLDPHPRRGTAVGVLGYPEDGGFVTEPGRLGQTESVSTENAYGEGPVTRSIVALRGLVRPGNSGGPLIDAGGQVEATVFATITGGNPAQGPGGFAIPNSVVGRAVGRAEAQRGSVGTGQCAG